MTCTGYYDHRRAQSIQPHRMSYQGEPKRHIKLFAVLSFASQRLCVKVGLIGMGSGVTTVEIASSLSPKHNQGD